LTRPREIAALIEEWQVTTARDLRER
jgi:hypothetical protein